MKKNPKEPPKEIISHLNDEIKTRYPNLYESVGSNNVQQILKDLYGFHGKERHHSRAGR